MSEDSRRCIVIDDQPIVRLGLRTLLEGRYEVEEVADGDRALAMLTELGDFDVAIVDIDAGSRARSGLATIRSLLEAQPGLGIVAYVTRPERHVVAELGAAGVIAYVSKRSPTVELGRAVDAAADAERFVDPAAGAVPSGPHALTRRQREILQLYADGHSTDATAKRLGLSPETVRTHTKGILARLEARDRAHAAAIALRGSLIE